MYEKIISMCILAKKYILSPSFVCYREGNFSLGWSSTIITTEWSLIGIYIIYLLTIQYLFTLYYLGHSLHKYS